MTARDYARVLREGWIIILACIVLAALCATVVSITKQPVYQATSTLAVSTCVAVENSPVCDPVGGMSYAIQRANIYSTTATSLPVLRRALELTDAVVRRSTLQDHTTVTQTPDSPVIDVTARWHDAAEAADIANALSQAIVEYSRGSVDSFESDMTTVTFSVISEAAPPSDPLDDTFQTIGTAVTLGLLVGLVLALVRYYSDKRLRDREDVERNTGVAVLASISLGRAWRDRRSRPVSSVGATSEAFRRLRAATAVRIEESGIRTLLVASPNDGLASAEVAKGLAGAIAETGSRVAVVDLDFRRVEDAPAINGEVGITDIMEGVAGVDATLQRSAENSVLHIPAGRSTSDPATKLASSRLADVLAEVGDHVDILIVNSAAVLTSADSLSAAGYADGVLLVVELGVTKLDDLRESVRSLELVGTRPLGIAMLN